MIREIIKDELIEIYFQPIVSIRSKKLYAFEALTRCTYNGEFISPNVLFDLAIESNLSLELDVLTRNKSIEKFKEYYLENNDLVLFLNFESSLINNFDKRIREYCFTQTIKKIGEHRIMVCAHLLKFAELHIIINHKKKRKFQKQFQSSQMLRV